MVERKEKELTLDRYSVQVFMKWLYSHLHVDGTSDELWYICWPDGEKYAGPYFRAQDAKGQLTRILND